MRIVRSFSTGPTLQQARPKLRAIPKNYPGPRRPAFEPSNPFLPIDALEGKPAIIQPEDSPDFPVLIPTAAIDPTLTRKIKSANELSPEEIIKLRQVTLDGQNQVEMIVDDWIRNELNVMGTIREETILIFKKLILNPSTLAPLAQAMKLKTAGRRKELTASHDLPKRVVPASTASDEELTELLYYLIGSIHRSLPPIITSKEDINSVDSRLKKYVKELIIDGISSAYVADLPARLKKNYAKIQKKTAAELLIRASQLSGQAMKGHKHGHARAELRVAQLGIWGERRAKKLKKLVPDQVIHQTLPKLRKAKILKQRWIDEELKMVRWRNRLLNVEAVLQNEEECRKLHKLEHKQNVKLWNQERRLASSSSSSSSSSDKDKDKDKSFFSKFFNFWPFVSSPSPTVTTTTTTTPK
ncbi:hypothetical protein MJO29_008417 [Puccinia striiformis f. sp. tritici]|uniref:hypothetical protein n=1 Tax=Puccinia striiformis f. sp. tritici TaxID=168172 RepID=UPI002007EA0C|nr:hypothetical protein Pst134EA_015411 [Puccinia striiformis f. sp. tritici]KAH9463327.1 hypothetical protein Pst134EA_015411 [Puccinia striiformis f. sp. tritici]KAI7952786.1 hypothetical protein MJO29_008417 [Puccinia striiformis f. sp. tritici]